MILTLQDISNIIVNRPNKDIVDSAKKRYESLSVHVTGNGLDEYWKRIASFETPQQYEARKMYGKSNRAIFQQIGRPLDRIFSARGGSIYHRLPPESQVLFNQKLQSIENGISLRRWMQQFWKHAYLTDPMGLIYVTVGNNDVWPEYICSEKIYDYKLNGAFPEYIVFEPEIQKVGEKYYRYYRVVDDAYDYLIKHEDNIVSIVEQQTFKNYFGRVPAILASDIPIPGTDEYDSPYSPLVELADEFLREGSVKSVFKMKIGFPREWQYATSCQTCGGHRNVNGERCASCNGTGFSARTDVSETIILAPPVDDQKPIGIPMGYVSPDVSGWEQMTKELDALKDEMFISFWGTQQLVSGNNETATGRFIDTQPVVDRQNEVKLCAESRETFITELCGYFLYPTQYQGSSILYGTRLHIEPHDTLLERYNKARREGTSTAVLDDLLLEYIYSKFENTDIELRKEEIKIKIEPFKHYSLQEVLSMPISDFEKNKKIYFDKFLTQIKDSEYLTPSAEDTLSKKLDEFINNLNYNNNNGGERQQFSS